MTDVLSIDAAAAMVTAMDSPVPVVAAKEPEPPQEASDASVEQDALAEGAEAEADALEAGENDDEQEAEAVPAVEAPQWWDSEDKAVFAGLTPEQQAVIRKQEDKREAVTQKEKSQAIEARKVALAAAEKAKVVVDQLEAVLPDRMAAFQAKYAEIDQIDWDAWNVSDPVAANRYMAQYNSDRLTLERTFAAKAEAGRVAQETFVREQSARLAEIAPEIAQSPENLKAIGDYAVKHGVTSEDLTFAEASHMVILNKARLYDELMAKAAAKPATPPMQKPTPAKVPPQGQPRPASTSQQRVAQEAKNRFAQTRSIDDAASLIAKLGFV